MVQVELVRDLDFPLQQVWETLGDFANMEWTGAPEVEILGEGIGMTRRVIMAGMEPIDEVLQSLDHEANSFSYTIPRGLPLPVTDYTAGARAEALDDHRTRIYWSCTCTPTDGSMSAADVQALMERTYTSLLDGLANYLQQD
jgi:hypothetical protein